MGAVYEKIGATAIDAKFRFKSRAPLPPPRPRGSRDLHNAAVTLDLCRIAGCPDNSTFPLPEIEPSASTWAVIFALPLPRIVTVADFAIRPSNWASPEPGMLSLMRLQFPSQRNSRCLDVHLKLWLVDLG